MCIDARCNASLPAFLLERNVLIIKKYYLQVLVLAFLCCTFPLRVASAGPVAQVPLAQGIDVSSWQGSIDWVRVKSSGVQFAYLRIGPVYGCPDSYFERNASECERLGIPYGIYYYSYAGSNSDARREADYVLTCSTASRGSRAAGTTSTASPAPCRPA